MSSNFRNDVCNTLTLSSSWKNSRKMVDSSCQSSSEIDYDIADCGCQSGESSICVEKVVKSKDASASLIVFCRGRIKKYDEAIWGQLIENGYVTVGKLNYFEFSHDAL